MTSYWSKDGVTPCVTTMTLYVTLIEAHRSDILGCLMALMSSRPGKSLLKRLVPFGFSTITVVTVKVDVDS